VTEKKVRSKITPPLSSILWVLIISSILFGLLPITALQVYDEGRELEKSHLLKQWRSNPGDEFSIVWTHSVTHQPINEVYIINDDLTIGIVEMTFNEHGPNLPSAPEGSTRWEIKDGMFRVYNYDTVFEKLPVRIGQVVADHTLYYQKQTIPLRELSRPGGFITIQARRIIIIQFLFEEGRLWMKKN